MSFKVFILPFFTICLISAQAFAMHPLVTDDTGTQGRGKFQLEVNGEYSHDKDDGVTTKTTQLASILSYGIIDPLDMVLTISYQHNRIEDSGKVTKGDGFSSQALRGGFNAYT